MLHLIAFRNVRVHWRQSLAALLSISGAFFSLVIFQGYMLDVEALYLDAGRNRSMYGDVIIENRDAASAEARKDPWKYHLSSSDQKIIAQAIQKRAQDIAGTVRFLDFQGMISTGFSSKIFFARTTDVEEGAKVRANWQWDVLYGVPMFKSPVKNPLILAQSLAHQLGCDPVKKVFSLRKEGGYPPEDRPFECRRPDFQLAVTTESGNLNAMDFQAVGIMNSGYKDIDSRFLALPLPLAQKLLNTDGISFWAIKLKDNVNASEWIEDIHREVSSQNPELLAKDWKDLNLGEIYRKTMSFLDIFRNFVTLVVALISVLSVSNTMVKIVKERTREIGTLLSLGFQRSQVLGIFLLESLFLGLLGSGVGMIASLAVSLILNDLKITYRAGILAEPVYFGIQINPMLYLTALTMLLTLTVFTSFVTCRSTVEKKIVECLGHV